MREAAKRTLGQRHYDVQIIGAGALHRGMIAEMRTGEGKTLVSTMPSYLNALGGGASTSSPSTTTWRSVTPSGWAASIASSGSTVGLIQAEMTPEERRPAYAADITYGTNNEFGFDYLRDNMAMRVEDLVQRGHAYAIVDEVDSILIDEARTPLIISGRVGETGEVVPRLRPDRPAHCAETITTRSTRRSVRSSPPRTACIRVEQILGVENMYDFANVDLIHHLDVALKAKELYRARRRLSRSQR